MDTDGKWRYYDSEIECMFVWEMAVSVPIMVHNRYFFANGRKDKSIYFKAEYLATDSGNGRKP